ncbi:sulfide quinone reductase Sqr [Thermosynechococcus sp. NK55a]|jgi:sulfide:quinone oxidoreductase|uniref:NAD(P)/FAD-dependent oxidoreductase n=1 Tax=unclassified Thermosynechococcus TaxID=2622553 RepID=UPI0003D7F8C7|nr:MULTISPECIES: FAD-dependent oxidoreductase [unclassified Thermosynechococcus]AHB87510.1 sulfide quinone reductase Sqr [Thermosynechococcus sp. NK55a]RMH63833.1 MAG: sulfide:quinone reductase [Cyanobacteria bacterium J003]HIK22356.1 FAD-dependent oxidoreductase [Thermosynechococcus sp. M3746_W2019_013]
MARVVVLGAGIGGLPTAYELKHRFGDRHEVILVSDVDRFTFIPGLVAVALGYNSLEHLQVPLERVSRRHRLRWVQGKVQRLAPEEKKIYLPEQTLDYDYLVIATGAELALDTIPGLGIYSHSVCTPAHAVAAQRAWQEFLKEPGDLVVGAAPGASCFGPAYEFLFLAEQALRRHGLRDQVKITFITPEPYVGHLGIGGLANGDQLTRNLIEKRGIETITNAEITAIEPHRILLRDGQVIPFGYSMILPPFRGVAFVRASGLGNEKGFLPLLPTLQHPNFPEIYGVGISVHFPPLEVTPVPMGVPKTGQMTEEMAIAASHNIAVALGELAADPVVPTLDALCFADFGNTGIAYIAAPVIPEPPGGNRRLAYAIQGLWVSWVKAAFERYFLLKMWWGLSVPWFEQWGLRLFFGLSLVRPLQPTVFPEQQPIIKV